MRVLNVGGNRKSIPLPKIFEGWEQTMLDIDPASDADLICDARNLSNLSRLQQHFDGVHCSHNLEHYYRHDVAKVLAGFRYALRDDGFAHIQVPNMQYVCAQVAAGADIEDVAYISPAGPIRYVDMMYGLGSYIEMSGQDFMCHKNGFTPQSLGNLLLTNGFPFVFVGTNGGELWAYGFKNKPSEQQMRDLHLVPTESGGPGDNAGSLSLTAQPEPAAAAPTKLEGA